MNSPFFSSHNKFLDIKILTANYHEKINSILKECFGVARSFQNNRIHFGKLELVSYLNVIPMKIKLKQDEYKMGGICSVSTLPNFRGQGYASALMETVLEWMQEDGFDIAVLYAANDEIYKSFGFIQGPEALNKKPISQTEGEVLHMMAKKINPNVKFDLFDEEYINDWKKIPNF